VKAFWQFLAALWPDDETTAALPAEGAPGVYVPTLDTTTRIVTWQAFAVSGTADLIEDGDVIYEDGSPLYE
jgi:hypothetical protein